MAGVDAPIVPVYLDRVWGSIFSFESGRILNRLPARLPYPVTVAFGPPLPATASAFAVRNAVADLGAETFRYREDEQELLSMRFYRQARQRPFRFCMADATGVRLNGAQACIAAMALSRALGRLTRGQEMVGVLLPASVGGALVNVALTILGKCPVNLNYTAPEAVIARAIEKCGIRTIVGSRTFMEKAHLPARPGMVCLEDLRPQVTLADKCLAAAGFWLLPHAFLRRLFCQDRRRTVQSVATVIFSSGSTGDPKGVMLSHANINANIEGFYQVFAFARHDVFLGTLPFFHSFGYTATLWAPLTTGLGVVYQPNPLDFKEVGELVAKHRIACMATTPTFLMGYLRKCTREQFASLRYVIVGAEKLKPRLAAAFAAAFGLEPLEGYGCTELSPIVAVNRPDVAGKRIRQTGRKEGTIGHPLPGVAVRVVAPDTFAPLPAEAEGLLLVKGRNVMLGYLDDDARTREVMHDGWYVTGDLASVDADGFITIKDRLSRFSKIGGEMVPHLRLEEEIHRVLGVAGEQVCVVTAVADERKGESLAVLHTVDLDPAKVRAELARRGLPNLWVPKAEAFVRVGGIPLLGSGKLDLKGIKAMAAERLRGGTAADTTASPPPSAPGAPPYR